MPPLPKPEVDRLIETHRTYAHALAAEFWRRLPSHVDKQDIEAAGELGLVEAANAFEPQRGVLFKTFAYYRIRGAIYDWLRQMTWFSKSLYDRYGFEMAANELQKEAPERPLDSTIGAVVSCYMLSLDGVDPEAVQSGAEPIDEWLEREQESHRLRSAVAALPEKNRRVVEGHYFRRLTFAEIGKALRLSESWVCRIHAKSLEMLSEALTGPAVGRALGRAGLQPGPVGRRP